MNHRTLFAAAAAACFTLAACGQSQPEVVDSRSPDPMAAEIANAAPVELPPPVKASASLRCSDNSLVFIDFFEGDKAVNFRADKGAVPVRLAAPEAGQPFVAEGYSVTGGAKSATVVQPGKGSLTCKA